MDISWIRLVAGRPCLDFVNTVSNRQGPRPVDHLDSYPLLLAWSEKARTVPPAVAQLLRRTAREWPAGADAALAEARELREAIAHLASSSVSGDPPAPEQLARLNRHLVRSRGAPVGYRDGGFEAGWPYGPEALDSVLVPIAVDAAALLTSAMRARVRICESDDGCGWMFVDETRTRTRRWCDMRTCGNRAKARRHYARARGEPRPAEQAGVAFEEPSFPRLSTGPGSHPHDK